MIDRNREGKTIEIDIDKRLQAFKEAFQAIEPFEITRIDALKQRLMQSLNEIAATIPLNEDRFQQELIYYIEKYDINEEKVRISAHLDHFHKAFNEKESQGRKLLFIVQELWREVNTLGVKSYHPNIQGLVVVMKDELEKIKELLMNIL